MKISRSLFSSLLLSSALVASALPAYASDDGKQYSVTITNITRGVDFTPHPHRHTPNRHRLV